MRFGWFHAVVVAEVVAVGVGLAVSPRWTDFLAGDCPYYAATAESLLRDGDFDLTNQLGPDRESLKAHHGFFARRETSFGSVGDRRTKVRAAGRPAHGRSSAQPRYQAALPVSSRPVTRGGLSPGEKTDAALPSPGTTSMQPDPVG